MLVVPISSLLLHRRYIELVCVGLSVMTCWLLNADIPCDTGKFNFTFCLYIFQMALPTAPVHSEIE